MRGREIVRWLFFIAVGVCLVTIASPEAAGDKLSKSVDRLANELVETGQTAALGIAIDQGGTVLHHKGYGFADIDNKVPATPETIYRIGSVTKQFTAVAIVQLVAAGKLTLDDSVTMLLPEYPATPKPVAIEHLLQHTSGIPDFTRDPSHRPNAFKVMSHAEMIARFDSLPLDFNPGSRHSYSNSGYYLLGMIIEQVTGQSYADYLAEHVLARAGLEHTRFEAPDGSGRAQGYRRDASNLVLANPISMTQPFAAGALVSTTGDLLKWQRALLDGRTDPPNAFQRITSDTVRAGRLNEFYGYGIRVSTKDGRKVISHGGGIEGFGSLLAYYPESDSTIVIIANTEGFNTGQLLEEIAEALLGPAPQSGGPALK